jgi:paraquat-inducible protein B
LSTALRDMSEAARAIRRLADTLERHPDNLLYGRKKQE